MIRNRFYISAVVSVLLLVVLTVSGCGGDKTSTAKFDTPTYPFSFDYPDGWKVTRNPAFVFGSDDAVRSVGVTLKEPDDEITVAQYELDKELPDGFNANQEEIDRIVRRLTRQSNGSSSDSIEVSFGGIPGYQYVVEYPGGNGVELLTTLTFLFQGKNEFLVNCQSSPANRAALDAGCEQVLNSLSFS